MGGVEGRERGTVGGVEGRERGTVGGVEGKERLESEQEGRRKGS